MTEIKVGDKYKRWDGRIGEITAVGRKHALIAYVGDEMTVRLCLLGDPKLFAKVKPFFEIGKTYVFHSALRAKYLVVDIRAIGDKAFAITEAVDHLTADDEIVVLSDYDFCRMVEVANG